MYDSHHVPHLFGGFRTVLFLAGGFWTLNQIYPLIGGDNRISVSGDYSSLAFPDSEKLELVTPQGERRTLKSVWQFRVKNDGEKPADGLTFELPFNGFYQVQFPGQKVPAPPADFNKSFSLGPVTPAKEISVTVWSDRPVDAGQEKETRISSPRGVVDINYPVKVTGFLAWVERSKVLISVLIFIAAMLCLM